MSNEILNSLIKEYEQKKLLAELDLEKRKNDLYKKVPKLKQIEDDLNQFAINTAKNILKNNEASINELEIKASQLKKEKIEILKELNLPTDYLQPFYECKICNDTGYIMNNNYKTEMCNCLKQKLLNYSFNKSNMSNLDKENFNTFNENIFSDEVDLSKYKFHSAHYNEIELTKNKYTTNIVISDSISTDTPWILATSGDYNRAIKDYSYRFGGVETIFKNQKSNGFYIEDTVNCSLKYFQSMYCFSCIGVLLLTIIGDNFAKNTRTYRKLKITTHTKSNGKKSRIISLFNIGLILFHRAFMSLKYVKIDFRFILYDA